MSNCHDIKIVTFFGHNFGQGIWLDVSNPSIKKVTFCPWIVWPLKLVKLKTFISKHLFLRERQQIMICHGKVDNSIFKTTAFSWCWGWRSQKWKSQKFKCKRNPFPFQLICLQLYFHWEVSHWGHHKRWGNINSEVFNIFLNLERLAKFMVFDPLVSAGIPQDLTFKSTLVWFTFPMFGNFTFMYVSSVIRELPILQYLLKEVSLYHPFDL